MDRERELLAEVEALRAKWETLGQVAKYLDGINTARIEKLEQENAELRKRISELTQPAA